MTVMRNIINILLAVIMLTGITEMHQLLKMPQLLSHYRHHKTEDPSITLIAFLKLHYSSQHHPNDNDDQEDNQLPFRSTGNVQHTDVPVVVRKELIITTPSFVNNTVTISHPEGELSDLSFAIFHPPRA
ncbi:MAG TPA: hypothetical protein VFV31_00805 [Chitinophagaceae bacterium]|nr:hypothetical protein [Chitinophagaceae bacterium]